MNVPPISSYSYEIYNFKNREDIGLSFGHSNQLKTLWKKGKLPSVQFDISGRKLTQKNVTLDHVIPKSKGGKSITENYMLATKEFNNGRGNQPLKDFMDTTDLVDYLNQFIDVHVDNFWGNKYIKGILETLKEANKRGV